MIVEVGFLLNKPFKYYHELLLKQGAINTFNCETRDIYWSNRSFDGLAECQIKAACIRYRCVKGLNQKEYPEIGHFQNYHIFNSAHDNSFPCLNYRFPLYEYIFQQSGWQKVFDTTKTDFQYQIGNMKSRIQLQNISGIGLVLYYDNPDLYHLDKREQRKALIDELNAYGFEFTYETLGIDKLRSLHTGDLCYSDNQAG